ncbi:MULTISPECIES: c-type cytochrome [Rhodobacterales]|uniref:Cytochrome c, mono-and diheme variants n=2 Tax=Rhodobacterales TaxID=204455 RepID=A0A1H3EED6_9RHOB|nr:MULTISPECIES: cytochrome c [Rhodobacterales]MBB5723399.1 mono/diheme cytochrome c family protein [Yoonia ponticola]MEE4211901.1 cytochrome c [Parvularcula sp.]OUS21379.1 cytochrome C [Rhodobacterales bacterium 59_46_T64]AUQ64872.1 Cytochrome c, mono- and diheme variant [Phaeobacter inhibens]SDX76284.1 Cytochrome c, mono-and diheme variants [Sulfitobacter pontiacus]
MNRIVALGLGAAVLAGAAALAFGWGTSAPAQTVLMPSDPDVVALGQAVYVENCASCHGANLDGQPNWRSPGPDGRLPAPPHDETGHTWHHDGDTLFQLTKYGTGALIGDPDYQSNMPIYEGVLTDEEIIAVLSYIKSTWPQDIRDHHDALANRQ